MGVRVINTVEKNVVPKPYNLVVVPANKPIQVLAAINNDFEEYAARYIQNVGPGITYYNFTSGTPAGTGVTSTDPAGIGPNQFCGIMDGAGTVDSNGFGYGQQVDCSNHPGDVWVYSTTGTTIAITVLIRKDLIRGGNPM